MACTSAEQTIPLSHNDLPIALWRLHQVVLDPFPFGNAALDLVLSLYSVVGGVGIHFPRSPYYEQV